MNFKLLYIEDNMLNIRLVKRGLSTLPLDVSIAQDGDEGLQFVNEHQPHLVLVDINLPTISGIDVIIQMKAKKHTRHIPIIALTADNTVLTQKLCENYGVSAYLTKPISRHTLIQTILAFLPDLKPVVTPMAKPVRNSVYAI